MMWLLIRTLLALLVVVVFINLIAKLLKPLLANTPYAAPQKYLQQREISYLDRDTRIINFKYRNHTYLILNYKKHSLLLDKIPDEPRIPSL